MRTSLTNWVLIFLVVMVSVMVLAGLLAVRYEEAALKVVGPTLQRVLTRPYFTVGDLAVTPIFLLKSILFLAVLGFLSRRVTTLLQKRVLPRTTMDVGHQYAMARFAGYLVFFVGLLVGVQSSGINLNSLIVLGGAIGVGVGFGLQSIANNFISGLILLMERPIKVGDRVEVAGIYGDVIRIAGRSTWVLTNRNVVIIIPNSEFITKQVINWTANDRQVRYSIPLGVSYNSDPESVREILLEVAGAHPDVLESPRPDVIFKGFGDSSLDFDLRVWTIRQVQTPKILASELYFAIFKAFKDRGVEIPFPQRDLHLRSAKVPIPLASAG